MRRSWGNTAVLGSSGYGNFTPIKSRWSALFYCIMPVTFADIDYFATPPISARKFRADLTY